MMIVSNSKQVSFDSRYVADLVLDESNIASRDYAAGLDLLRNYSKIPEEEITSHVAQIQRRAYAICPYPCIGLLRFLICSLSEHTLYPTVPDRLHHGATYLDLGCRFAQDIRKLAYDGAPTRNCTAVDLEPRFFELAEALFRDHGRLQAEFRAGDVFDAEEKEEEIGDGDRVWKELRGRTDIVHASSFLHLFGLTKQRRIAHLISTLVRPVPGSLVLGLQLAARGQAEHIPVLNEEEPTYCHSLESMQAMWTEAGEKAGLLAARNGDGGGEKGGLVWKVELQEREVPESHRIGLLSNPKLREGIRTARLVGSSSELN